MFYAWNFELTEGKSAASKTKHILHMERGTITRCEVVFPVGCANLVFVHVNQALHQVYPKNPDMQYIGDGATIVSVDEYEIREEPFQLEFYGWNTDDIFCHTVTVRIQLIPRREIVRLALAEAIRFLNLERPR